MQREALVGASGSNPIARNEGTSPTVPLSKQKTSDSERLRRSPPGDETSYDAKKETGETRVPHTQVLPY